MFRSIQGIITKKSEDYSAVMDSLIWCKFVRKAFDDFYEESQITDDPIDHVQAVTESLRTGKRKRGIQDFDLEVQKEINRVQPPELIEDLMVPEIRSYFQSINFDILVGLPKQTIATMRETMEKALTMQPDRLTFTYVSYNIINFICASFFISHTRPFLIFFNLIHIFIF